MVSFKKFYYVFTGLVFLEIINLAFKLFNAYYFNLIILFAIIVATAWLGWESKINRIIVVTFTVIGLLLSTTMFFVVWH